MKSTTTYFGDGVYATFDGYHIKLEANGLGPLASDRIYLEPGMAQRIGQWVQDGHKDYQSGDTFAAANGQAEPEPEAPEEPDT